MLIIVLMSFVFAATACSITGNSSEMLRDDIISCSLNTDIDFLRLNGVVQACHRGNSLYFAVENTGTNKISGLSVLLDSDYPVTMTIKEVISPGDVSQQSLSFGAQQLGGVVSLRIYPLSGLSKGSDAVVCKDAVISAEISEC